MATIGIDFDGPIHAYSAGWQGGAIYDDPTPGAMEMIAALQVQGHAVFVLTARPRGQLWDVAEWIVARSDELLTMVDPDDPMEQPPFWEDSKLVLVTNRKLPAVAYIDDRAIRFNSWEQSKADLFQHEEIQA